MFEDLFLSPSDHSTAVPVSQYIMMQFIDFSYHSKRNNYNRAPDSFDDINLYITVSNSDVRICGSFVYKDFIKTFKLLFG